MKKLLVIISAGTILLLGAVGVAYWLSWQPQAWYDPPDYSLPEVKMLADKAEYRLNEEFHKVRPIEDVWRLRITDEAMNTWLSGRLEGWLTHDQELEMPPELVSPQVHATSEGIWIAAMVDVNGNTFRPIALQLWVAIERGVVTVFPTSIRLGRVPIPVSVFEQMIKDVQQKTGDISSIVPLMDDREVEIQSILFEEGALVLTCQTHLPQ